MQADGAGARPRTYIRIVRVGASYVYILNRCSCSINSKGYHANTLKGSILYRSSEGPLDSVGSERRKFNSYLDIQATETDPGAPPPLGTSPSGGPRFRRQRAKKKNYTYSRRFDPHEPRPGGD